MILSSFLLGPDTKAKDKGKSVDKGLDDFFRSNTAIASTPASVPGSIQLNDAQETGKGKTVKEKKRKERADDISTVQKSKKLKGAAVKVDSESNEKRSKKTKKHEATTPDEAASDPIASQANSSEVEDTNNERDPQASSSQSASRNDQANSDSESDGDPSRLVHESVLNSGKSKHGPRTKFVPESETAEQRNERTVFVGNVPVDLVKDRSLQKKLKRHIVSFVPSAKIESVRFRSVAFNKPTAQLPSAEGPSKSKDGRQHDRARAASWRKSKGEEEDAANAGKTFLTPAEKKRVAFIKQEIHESVDAVNAYIVFAHPPPAHETEKRGHVPPPKTVMDPYEAARVVVKEADRSTFMGRTLRVDAVSAGSSKVDADGDMKGDPKATVFVGNLDFASKEEDLRTFFETLMVAERGKPGRVSAGHAETDESEEDDDEDDIEGEGDEEADEDAKVKAKQTEAVKAWVKRVRIIRDKDTLMGKGFAYVQFADRECVDEILTLEQDRLKFAKRKLRVQRCKTLPGASKLLKTPRPPKQADTKSANAISRTPRQAPPATLPKGNPALGEKLAGLSKEERKAAKASDADRVARRLAKKQAKTLAEKGIKSKMDIKAGDLLKVRKRAGQGDKGKKAGEKKKGRVRSGRALLKMNTKK